MINLIYLKDNSPQKELSAIHQVILRLEMKRQYTEEMKEIDWLVEKIVS